MRGKGSESVMASGSGVRGDKGHESNISLSAPTENDKGRQGKIERERRGKKRHKMAAVEKM